MYKTFAKRLMVLIMSFSLLGISLPSVSYAGIKKWTPIFGQSFKCSLPLSGAS